MLRSAVERQFEIIGEPLSGAARADEQLASRISDDRRIVSFRNILIRGDGSVDAAIVWDLPQSRLPALRREVRALLESGEAM